MEEEILGAALGEDATALQKLLDAMDISSLTTIKDKDGCNALHRTVKYFLPGAESCIKLLLEKAPSLMAEKNNNGNTPLMSFLQSWEPFDISLMLLHASPSTATIANYEGETPLHHAAALFKGAKDALQKSQAIKIAQILIDNGALVNAEDSSGLTPLHFAVKSLIANRTNGLQMIDFLFSQGATCCSNSGVNALSFALKCVSVVAYLLEKDPSSINVPDKKGLTPLHCLLQLGKELEVESVKLLLDHGAATDVEPNLIDLAREKRCQFEIVELLLNNIPYDINSKQEIRGTLLQQYATSYKNVKKLIELGADASILPVTRYENSILKTAVKKCHSKSMECVKLLIEAGADPTWGLKQDSENILNLALERYAQEHQKHLVPLIEYLFSLPQFTDPELKIEIDRSLHPQSRVLQNFYEVDRESAIKILTCLLKSNFIEPDYEVPSILDFAVNYSHFFEGRFLTPIGALLNTDNIRTMLSKENMDLLALMFEKGFKVTDTSEEPSVPTVLTVLLAVQSRTFYPGLHKSDSLDSDSEEERFEGEDSDLQGEWSENDGSDPEEEKSENGDSDTVEEKSENGGNGPEEERSENDGGDPEGKMSENGDGDTEEQSINLDSEEVTDNEVADRGDDSKVDTSYIDKLMSMAEDFIKQGVNVEDMSLEFMNPHDENNEYHVDTMNRDKFIDEMKNILGVPQGPSEAELRQEFIAKVKNVRKELWLPDALWVTFLSGNARGVKLLLPYWSAPPLALLLFQPRPQRSSVDYWFPILAQYGGVPHGTEVMTRLSSLLDSLQSEKATTEMTSFQEFHKLHSSPLSLQELSRYVVRASVAAKAFQPGNSLPDLLASICPPGLKDYLLMKSREQPCATQVGDKKRIRSFQFIYSCSI